MVSELGLLQFSGGLPTKSFSLSMCTFFGRDFADRWISTVSGDSIRLTKYCLRVAFVLSSPLHLPPWKLPQVEVPNPLAFFKLTSLNVEVVVLLTSFCRTAQRSSDLRVGANCTISHIFDEGSVVFPLVFVVDTSYTTSMGARTSLPKRRRFGVKPVLLFTKTSC